MYSNELNIFISEFHIALLKLCRTLRFNTIDLICATVTLLNHLLVRITDVCVAQGKIDEEPISNRAQWLTSINVIDSERIIFQRYENGKDFKLD